MLVTCEKCAGEGMDNDLPRKRCLDCNGKGRVEIEAVENSLGDVVMVEDASTFEESEISGYSEVDAIRYMVTAVPNEQEFARALKKPWYIRLRDWYVGLFN